MGVLVQGKKYEPVHAEERKMNECMLEERIMSQRMPEEENMNECMLEERNMNQCMPEEGNMNECMLEERNMKPVHA